MQNRLKLLAICAGLLAAAKAIEAVSPQSSANFNIPRSVQPGSAQSKSQSANYHSRHSGGEVVSSTQTSTSYRFFAGGQHLLSYPGKITSLTSLKGPSQNEITLSWTAPGADGFTGPVKNYIIKYRLSGPIETQDDFESAFTYFSTYPALSPGQTQTALLTDLSPGPTHYFCVVAVDSFSVRSPLSNGTSAWTFGPPDIIPPSNISDLTALTGNIDGEIELRWTTPGENQNSGSLDAAKYRFHASTVNFSYFASSHSATEFGAADLDVEISTNGVGPGETAGYSFEGLNPGTTYFLGIISRDDALNWSFFKRGQINRLSTAPADDLALDPPTSADGAEVNLTSATISWTQPNAPISIDDRYAYRLYVATYEFVSSTDAAVLMSSEAAHPLSQATTAGLQINTTYFFGVTAVDSGTVISGLYSDARESSMSVLFSTATRAQVPGALSASWVSVDSVAVSWGLNGNPANPPTKYEFQVSALSNFSSYSSSITFAPQSIIGSLSANTTYFLRARAFNRLDVPSDFNSSISTPTLSRAPGLHSVRVFLSSVAVQISRNQNTIGTKVVITTGNFESTASSSGYINAALTTLSMLNLSPNTAYTIRSRAENYQYLPSTVTAQVISTATLPDVPTALSFVTPPAEVNFTSVTLTWNPGSNPLTPSTSYEIQVSTWDGFVGTVTSSDTFSVYGSSIGLVSDSTYYFRVKAYGIGGTDSAYSDLFSTMTHDNLPPSGINDLAAVTGSNVGDIDLSWTAPGDNGIDGQANVYEIRRAVPPFDWQANYNAATLVTNTKAAQPSGSPETYTVSNLTQGTTYAFNVRALDEGANRGPLSNGATSWAALANTATTYYLRSAAASNPAAARTLSSNRGGGSNVITKITVNGTLNNYHIFQPSVTVAAAPGAGFLPVAPSSYGWLFNSSLAGQTVQAGTWKLTLRYQESSAALLGRMYYRISRVTTTASSVTLQSYLSLGNNGWVGWGSTNPLAGSAALVTTTTIANIQSTYFDVNDRLHFELAFQPTAGATSGRTFTVQVDSFSSLQTTNIGDTTPPDSVTTLTALVNGVNEGEVRLQWQAPGDDGAIGRADYYDMRYTNDVNFDWSTNFEGGTVWKSSRTTGGVAGFQETELVTGLSGGVTYYFRLKSYDDANPRYSSLSWGATQWAQVDRVPPNPISELTALATSTEGQIELRWSSPGDDDLSGSLIFGSSYTIHASTSDFRFYSSTVAQFGEYDCEVRIGTLSALSGLKHGTLITGLNPGTTWYFGVIANDEHGNYSSWTKNAQVNIANSTTAFDAVLSAPTDLSSLEGDVQSSSITLRWTPPVPSGNIDDRYSYRLYAATYAFVSSTEAAVVLSSETMHPLSFAVTDQIQSNAIYFFRVTAVDSGTVSQGLYSIPLESPYSALFSTVTLVAVPGTSTATEVNVTSVTVQWEPNGNPLTPPTSYEMLISLSEDFIQASSSVTYTTQITSASLMANTTYFFKARAFNRYGSPTSFNSIISTVTHSDTVTLTSPQWAVSDITDTSATARWLPNRNPVGTLYHVEFATSTDFAGAVTSSDTYALYATTDSLLGNTTIAFRVQSVNFLGLASIFTASNATSTLAGNVFLNSPNWAVEDLDVSVATARWNSGGNSDDTIYRVRFSTSESFLGPVTIIDTTQIYLSTSGLLGNTTIAFQVTALNSQGQPSSSAVSVATASLAAAPIFNPVPHSQVGPSSQTVTWISNGNTLRTLYSITVSSVADFSLTTASDTYSLSISTLGLYPDTSYYYQGSAINSQGIAALFTNQITTSTFAKAPRTHVTSFTSVVPNDIDLQWDPNGNPSDTFYDIVTGSATAFTTLPITTSTVFDVIATTSGVEEGTTYFFKARAVNRLGFETGFTFLGSTRTPISTDFVAPNNVSDLTALAGAIDGQVILSWTSPGDDNNTGVLKSGKYDIRYSSTPFTFFSSTYADLSGISASVGLGDIVFSTTGVNPGTKVGYPVDGLNPGTTYHFAVIARDDSSNWSFAVRSLSVNRLSSATPQDIPLSAPTNLQTQISSTSATITWNPSGAPTNIDDRDFYRLYTATSGFASASNAWVHFSSQVPHPLASATTDQLTPNTSYVFRIDALDWGDRGNGLYSLPLASPLSDDISTHTLSAIPGASTSSVVGLSSITISWLANGNPLTPPTSYEMQISSSEDFLNQSSSVTYKTFASTQTLAYNTTYFFRTRAFNRIGIPTEFGDVLSTATLSAAPGLLGFSVYSTSVSVSLDPNLNPQGTRVFVSSANFDLSNSSSGPLDVTATLLTLENLTPNSAYSFYARTENYQLVPSSQILVASTATVPAVPGDISFEVNPAQVNLPSVTISWTPNGNPLTPPTSYEMQISTVSDFLSGVITSSNTFNLYATSTTLASGTPYFFRVRAYGRGGSLSPFNDIASTVTRSNVPSIDAFTSSQIGISSITVTWQNNGNAPGTVYRLMTSADPFFSVFTTLDTALLSATTISLSLNASYYFQVAAAPFQDFSAVSSTSTLPRAPGIHSFIVFNSSVSVYLAQNNNPLGTRLTLSTGAFSLSSSSSGIIDGNISTVTLINLTPNTAYTILARSENYQYLPSTVTAQVISTATLPDVPTALSFVTPPAEVNFTSVTVSWNPGGNPLTPSTSYEIQVSTWDGFVGTVTSSDTFSVYGSSIGLVSDSTYYFRVKAYGIGGTDSPYSDIVSTMTLDNLPPSGINDLAAVTGSNVGDIDLSWTAPGDNGIDGQAYVYEIRRAVPPFDWQANYNAATLVTNTKAAQPSGSPETYTVGNLTQGTTYAFNVRAIDEAGNYAPLSNGATSWAALANTATTYYLRSIAASQPAAARTLSANRGGGSNVITKITVNGTLNTYHIFQPSVTVAAAPGAGFLPVAPSSYGWLFDSSLAGQTVQAGTWKLTLRRQTSAAGLSGRIYYRISRVTTTASSVTLQSYLSLGNNGWVGWGSTNAHTGSVALVSTTTIANIQSTYFDVNDRLFYELAFQATAGATSGRTFTVQVDSFSSLQTTNIYDNAPPGPITCLVAFGTSAFLTEGQVRLNWVAPGDDGSIGRADYYDMRYTNNPNFDWTNNFISATVWKSSRTTGGNAGFGESELVTNTGLIGGVTYYFAITSYDNDSNNSLSNVTTAQAGYNEVAVVAVGTDTYNFGLVNMGESAVSVSSFTLKNAGNVLHDYRLSATTVTTDSPWSLDVASGTDKLILSGGFSDVPPGSSDFGPEDVILYGNQISDITRFAIGPSSGTTVPPNDSRYLWLKLDMPLLTSTTWEQQIQVTVTGKKSD